jgi:hypothetical protein
LIYSWNFPTDKLEGKQTLNEFLVHMLEQEQQAYALAREKLRVAAERRKAYYDIKVRRNDSRVGDWV